MVETVTEGHSSNGVAGAIVDAAAELEVELIGLNQLMFATSKEVEQTLEIMGETDPALITTHVTDDPGIDPKDVAPVLKKAVAYAESKDHPLLQTCKDKGLKLR